MKYKYRLYSPELEILEAGWYAAFRGYDITKIEFPDDSDVVELFNRGYAIGTHEKMLAKAEGRGLRIPRTWELPSERSLIRRFLDGFTLFRSDRSQNQE
jgi:hypothetical protein